MFRQGEFEVLGDICKWKCLVDNSNWMLKVGTVDIGFFSLLESFALRLYFQPLR